VAALTKARAQRERRNIIGFVVVLLLVDTLGAVLGRALRTLLGW
jgi:hypothetical protein